MEDAINAGRIATEESHISDNLYKSIRFNTAVFAGFKADMLQHAMFDALVDQDGVVRSFEEFSTRIRKRMKAQLTHQLDMECTTLTQRFIETDEWEQFEENKDVLPNLRWATTTSIQPNERHKAFWSIPLILPVDDPRWNRHRPGDHWGCKCLLEATDEETTPENEIPLVEYKRAPGLERLARADRYNLIGAQHPYYSKSMPKAGERVKKLVADDLGIKPAESVTKHDSWRETTDGLYFTTPSGVRVSRWADAKELTDNVKTAETLKANFPDLDIEVLADYKILGKKNPEFLVDGGITDAKRVKGFNGVKAGFKDAFGEDGQNCRRIIIDLEKHCNDHKIDRGNLHEIISRRHKDFEERGATHCYVVYQGRAIVITYIDITRGKEQVKEILKKLQAER